MPKFYEYHADDGTVYKDLTFSEALKAKQDDEAKANELKTQQASQQDEARLGPQIAAGIRSYELAKKDVADFKDEEVSPELTSTLAGLGGSGVGQQQASSSPAVPMQQERPQNTLSSMNSTPLWEGFTQEQQSNIERSQSAMQNQMSAPMMKLMEGLPPEVTDRLINEFRTKGDAKKFYSDLVEMNKAQIKLEQSQKEAEFKTQQQIKQDTNKENLQTDREKMKGEMDIERAKVTGDYGLRTANVYANKGSSPAPTNENIDRLMKTRYNTIKDLTDSGYDNVYIKNAVKGIDDLIAQETQRSGYQLPTPAVSPEAQEKMSVLESFIAAEETKKEKKRSPKYYQAVEALTRLKTMHGLR